MGGQGTCIFASYGHRILLIPSSGYQQPLDAYLQPGHCVNFNSYVEVISAFLNKVFCGCISACHCCRTCCLPLFVWFSLRHIGARHNLQEDPKSTLVRGYGSSLHNHTVSYKLSSSASTFLPQTTSTRTRCTRRS
jgi:hypothetical protein